MLLLDANVIIWWLAGDGRLGDEAKQLLAAPGTELSVSLLTLFEIELKLRTHKLRLPGPINDFVEKFDIEVYRPQANELSEIMDVPFNHSDPFDCALVGVARLKSWDVMTSDKTLIDIEGLPIKIIDSRK